MKSVMHRLAAGLLVGAAMIAAPALAKEQKPAAAPAQKPVKLSKPYSLVLSAAQKLIASGDNAGALAKVKEAQAFPPQDDDEYTALLIQLNIANNLKDDVLIEQTLSTLLATGKVPAADQPTFYRNVGARALKRKDYNAATQAFEKLVVLTPGDGDIQIALAELYNSQKQSAKAVDMIGKAIASQKAAGQAVPENWYRRALGIAYDAKLGPQVQTAALALVAAYPNAVNWRDALVITRDSFKLDDQANLDFMRLQASAGALNGERDYVEYATTALERGFPGEARSVLDEGVQRNMLVAAKPLVAELKKSADTKAVADKASLPGLEKESKANAKLAIGTADAYYGYGDFAKAATLYKLALGNAAVDQGTVNLRLGASLARAGDKAGAEAAFKAVKGGPREVLAQYWLAWLSNAKA